MDENHHIICNPLQSYNAVLNWNCNNICWADRVNRIQRRTEYCYSSYEHDQSSSHDLKVFPSMKLRSDNVPKTLVCHDMKGGYLEDRFVHDFEATDPYRFFHWSSIDVFVYFSHHFVTIPPVGWINAGHLHGVPVLGTVITENKEGLEICESIFSSKQRTIEFADKLADICNHYGFDGYLLNIENEISQSLIDNLVEFVKILKTSLKSICLGRNTTVVWYDSVILPTGQLKWQNKLNEHNKSFFDACDGIFLNYCWTEDDLEKSLECAGTRLRDVYVGVDVFGRNCYGGGGFNTDKALEIIRCFGLSTAIFAPGWTHELQSKEEGDDFIQREYNFWKKLQLFLYMYGPATLPFRTTFCQGYGERKYKEGDICSESPWINLRKQNYQPSYYYCTHLQGEDKIEDNSSHETEAARLQSHNTSSQQPKCTNSQDSCISIYMDDAYEGGSCLKISSCTRPKQKYDEYQDTYRLLACDFFAEQYVITIVYRVLQGEGSLKIILVGEHNELGPAVDFKKCEKVQETLCSDGVTLSVIGYQQSCLEESLRLDHFKSGHQDYPNGWKKRMFLMDHGKMRISEILVKTSKDCSVLLGLFEIEPRNICAPP